MDKDEHNTLPPSTDAGAPDYAEQTAEVEDLETLIRTLADAYDEQLASAADETDGASDSADVEFADEPGLVADESGLDEELYTASETDAEEAAQQGDALTPAVSSSSEESVDDIIARLLADTRELDQHPVASAEYLSLIDDIESLWSRLKQVWPAVEQHPTTVQRLEELWNTLKVGADGIDTLFTDLDATEASTLGITTPDSEQMLSDFDTDSAVAAGSQAEQGPGITESIDDIIARILGGESVTDMESGETRYDPWKDGPEPGAGIDPDATIEADTSASLSTDEETDEFLRSLGIDSRAVPDRARVHEEDVQAYLADLERDSVTAGDDIDDDTDIPTATPVVAATGISYISDEERHILDELLGTDTATDENEAAAQTADQEAASAATAEHDDELAAILRRIEADEAAAQGGDAVSDAVDETAITTGEPVTDAAARPGGSLAHEPTPEEQWQIAMLAAVSDADDYKAGISAGQRTVRDQTRAEVHNTSGNWLLPLAAAIVLGIGLWLLWGQFDKADTGGRTLVAQSRPQASAARPQPRRNNAANAETETPVSIAPAGSSFLPRKEETATTDDGNETSVVSDSGYTDNTYTENRFYDDAPAAEASDAGTAYTQDTAFDSPAMDDVTPFTPPADSQEAVPYYTPDPAYAAVAGDDAAGSFVAPPQAAVSETVQTYIPPPQAAVSEPVQAYIPPPQPVVAEVDLGPLEGALERLRNSTNDSISGLSQRVDRLERMIAGLQSSIDSLLRQSSDSANQSLSSLQRIQEKIIVLEEGQQKVVDATVERDGEGYTIIVNNADGSELLAGGASREIIHIVKKGDTLWHIAKKYINNPWRYPELARLSKISNPDLIYPGDRVRILLRAKQ